MGQPQVASLEGARTAFSYSDSWRILTVTQNLTCWLRLVVPSTKKRSQGSSEDEGTLRRQETALDGDLETKG